MSYYRRRARNEALVATVFLTFAIATTTAAIYGWLAQSLPFFVAGGIATMVNLYSAWSRAASASYYQARSESEKKITAAYRERELSEAWHLLNVLVGNMDDGPTWPLVLDWLRRNEQYRPASSNIKVHTPLQASASDETGGGQEERTVASKPLRAMTCPKLTATPSGALCLRVNGMSGK